MRISHRHSKTCLGTKNTANLEIDNEQSLTIQTRTARLELSLTVQILKRFYSRNQTTGHLFFIASPYFGHPIDDTHPKMAIPGR